MANNSIVLGLLTKYNLPIPQTAPIDFHLEALANLISEEADLTADLLVTPEDLLGSGNAVLEQVYANNLQLPGPFGQPLPDATANNLQLPGPFA